MSGKKGTDLELVVTAIEKSLDSSSIVKHNQFLPVLTSTEGATRQCDVVIYSGSEKRRFVTIVEVQDRNSKVNIATYDGWIAKRDEIGANQLVCVSRHQFPKSVREKARWQGARVSLIELASGVPDELPINFVKFHHRYENLAVSKVQIQALISIEYKDKILPEEFEQISKVQLKEKSFIDKEGMTTDIHNALVTVMRKIYSEKNAIHRDSCCLSFISNEELRLFVIVREHKIPVYLNVELLNFTYECHDFPMDVAVYRSSESGDLGWFFEADYETANGTVSIKIPITEHAASGGYAMLDIISTAPFESSHKLTQLPKD